MLYFLVYIWYNVNMFIDKIEQNRKEPPRFLYKYYRNLKYVADVLEHDRLHLDLPADYNDVFDSARVVDDNELDFILYNNQVDSIVRYTHCDYKKQVFDILNSCHTELLYLSDVFDFLSQNSIPIEIIEGIKNNFCKILRNNQAHNNRIICFTEKKSSLLMWAHYADHLKGACLCFDTWKDRDLFEHIYKVDYTRFRNRERNYNFYYSKSKDWSYEKEWRIVVQCDDEYIYTKSCVGIILGEKAPFDIPLKRDANNEVVPSFSSLSLTATMKGLNVYKAKANSLKYKIDIENWLV